MNSPTCTPEKRGYIEHIKKRITWMSNESSNLLTNNSDPSADDYLGIFVLSNTNLSD